MTQPKPLVWLRGQIQTPPFSPEARLEAGYLLRRLQNGEKLGLPQSRPMASIGRGCHELRIRDAGQTWRVIYAVEDDAIVILEVFAKKTAKTPRAVLDVCRRRYRQYQDLKE